MCYKGKKYALDAQMHYIVSEWRISLFKVTCEIAAPSA